MKKWKQSLRGTMVFFLFASGMGLGATVFPNNVRAEDSVNSQAETINAEAVTSKNNQVPIQILGINDFHGALSTTGSFYSDAGVKVEKAGSAALLSSYLNQAEKTFSENNIGGQTVRVHSGDMVGASPANSALLQDEPTVKILNQMNFTIGTLGNHEFDEGLEEFNRIMTAGAPTKDPYGILASYPREASKTEIVIGNVVKKGTQDIPFGWHPYTIKEFGEGEQKIKIGFIGVVTTEIPNLVLREHYEGYDFLDEATTITKYSKELREEGVNAIVVLAHIPAVSKQQQVSGDAAEILAKVNTLDPDNSVDALFAGHNHQYTNGVVNKTRVVQSTSQGKGYVDLQGKIDVATQDFVETPTAEVLPVSPVAAPAPDESVASIVKDADDRVTSVTSKKIGTSKENGNISREVNEFKESALGNLITDGQIAMAKAKGIQVDFAMTNNGGIRADLLVNEKREITWGAAQAVQPFGNIMQIVEMTGAQIEQVLNEQYDQDEKYFLQLSGLTYTFIENDAATQPFKVFEMKKADGSPILKDQKYRVVINDFLFGGGDGFSGFVGAKLIDAMQPDTETFINYIESKTANGEEITAKIEGRKSKYTEETNSSSSTEINEGQELIKKATTFDPLYVGNEFLTGVTIPNGKLSVIKETTENSSVKAVATEEPIVEQAAADGKFKLNIRSFDLKEGEKLIVTITDSTQNSVTFPVTVLKAVSESSSTTQTTTQSSSSSKDTNKLPKTGETNQGIAYFGIGLIVLTLVGWKFKKKTVIK